MAVVWSVVAAAVLQLLIAEKGTSVSVTIGLPTGPLTSDTFNVASDHDLFLKCYATGLITFPINWFRDDDPLLGNDIILRSRGQTMQIPHVTQSARGRYKCCAQQQVCSDEITVVVINPPIITTSWGHKRILHVQKGTNQYILSVNVTYPLTSHCIWYRDGEKIRQNVGELSYECEFSDNPHVKLELPIFRNSSNSRPISYDDSGRYRFTLHTSMFSDVNTTVSVRLIVVGPPVAPDAPSVSVVGQSSLSVTVNVNRSVVGDDSGSSGVYMYLLQYALVGTEEWVNINVTEAVLHGRVVGIDWLSPCSSYEVRMLVSSEYGVSPPSDVVQVTLPPLPYGKFQLYPHQPSDRFLTSIHNVQMAICLPPHLLSTAVGDFICHLPEPFNLNTDNVSAPSSPIVLITLLCAENEEAPNCTLMCPALVTKCLEGHGTLSKKEICSHNISSNINGTGTGGISEPPTVNSSHGTDNGSLIAGIVAGISTVVILIIVVIVILVVRYIGVTRMSHNIPTPPHLNSSQMELTNNEQQLHDKKPPADKEHNDTDSTNDSTCSHDDLSKTYGQEHSSNVNVDRTSDKQSLTSNICVQCDDIDTHSQRDGRHVAPMLGCPPLPQLSAKHLDSFFSINQLRHCQSVKPGQRFRRSLSANDAEKRKECVKQSQAGTNRMLLEGINKKVDMLHCAVGELMIETSQNSATLQQSTEQQDEGNKSLQIIESYSAKTYTVLTDLDHTN